VFYKRTVYVIDKCCFVGWFGDHYCKISVRLQALWKHKQCRTYSCNLYTKCIIILIINETNERILQSFFIICDKPKIVHVFCSSFTEIPEHAFKWCFSFSLLIQLFPKIYCFRTTYTHRTFTLCYILINECKVSLWYVCWIVTIIKIIMSTALNRIIFFN
jgi:hypothetical protein